MVIIFEPLLRDETLKDRLPIESWVFLSEVRKYIETRLAPLKGEIDKEEAEEDPKNRRGVLVYIEPGGINFKNYSPLLTKKMRSCFDNWENDVKLIWLRFDDQIRRFFN